MKRICLTAALLVGGFALVGCQSSPLDAYRPYKLGPALEIVATSVENAGGLKAFKSVRAIRTNAVIVIHDKGGRYVSRQKQVIDINGGIIEASASTGRGPWHATVRDSGRYSFSGSTAGGAGSRQLVSVLATLLHRVRGPLNLLGMGERVMAAEKTRLAGYDVVRVCVEGGYQRAKAYYFDATTGEMRFVACGAKEPGQSGTVTAYEYTILPNGMTFPKRIEVFEIGKNVLIGEKLILEADFADVEVRR